MTTPRAEERDRLDQHLHVRFRRAVFEQIDAAARRNDQSISEWARMVLRAAALREAEAARRKAQRAAA
jgi:hypothetical protein